MALTGVLPGGLIVGAFIAYPLSRLLLRAYRRSIGRSMAQAGTGAAKPSLPARASRPTNELQLFDAQAPRDLAASLLDAPWRAALAYVIAGGAFAAVMAAAWLVATRDDAVPLTKLAMLVWTYLWPAVVTVNLVAGLRRHHRFLIAAYFASYALLVAIALARNPAMRWYELPVFWLLINGPPTVLLLAFMTRRIRAVGPMVLAFSAIAVIGSQIPATIVSNDPALLKGLAEAGTAAGLSAGEIFWGIMFAGLIAFAGIGWLILVWLGRLYRRKRLSDQMLVIDAMWLVFALSHSINLVFEGWLWIFSGFVAFAAFVALRYATFAVMRARGSPPPCRLLLLRVFALGARSERLFDLVQKHWLRSGDIMLIAGPDLATTTVEPHEFLDFLGGGLSRQFVKDRADLAQRLQKMDTAIDPDLRYRVNEFFCHADTWQMTMRELAARGDAVLMDLRSFSASNQGCLFELGELLNSVDLRRVVFVIDATTDRRFLESSLASLWDSVAENSPNRTAAKPVVRVYDFSRQPEGPALRGLLAALGS